MNDHMRVVVADDHCLVREGTAQLLAGTGEIDVVSSADNVEDLLAAVASQAPDAVLTDIRMPPTHRKEGIDAALRIRTEHPGVGVVVLSQYSDPLYALELFHDGTDGRAYLLKDRVGEVNELLRAIKEVASGGSVIDPKVVESLLARRARYDRANPSTLSARELDVLREMANGRSNAAIADVLVLSKSAIEKHVNSIFAKLGVTQTEGTHRRVAAVLAYLSGTTT